MKTVKSIRTAENQLRKLAGEPSSFVIRTVHSNTQLTNGRTVCNTTTRIIIETDDNLTVDSQPQNTLQQAFDIVCQRITSARAQLAHQRNLAAGRKLAKFSPEVHG
jgi:hypothetical protein